ncbi:MAG: hypothetical protein K2X82_06205 [Gemmataceae bacterium]|nr:hypothetical protein [Gemmataceae bacterium]
MTSLLTGWARRAVRTVSPRPTPTKHRPTRLSAERLEGRDIPAVSVARVSDAYEGGAAGAFRFTRDGVTTQALTFTYGVSGTATPAADYAALSGSATFPAGQATVDVPVAAVNDTTYDPAETVTVTVGGGIPPASQAAGATADPDAAAALAPIGLSATVTIVDNDPAPVVTVTRISGAAEGGADGVFRFSRTGGTAAALTVNYTVLTVGPNMATPTDDYAALPGAVTIPAGAAYKDVTVGVVNDTTYEPTEEVRVDLAARTWYAVGAPASASVFIADNDPVPTVTFLQADATTAATYADVSMWTGAFAAGPVARSDFHTTDAQRFYATISDPGRKGQGGVKAKITAAIRTLDIDGGQADLIPNAEFEEVVAGSGNFRSQPLVLVSNKADDEFAAGGVADGAAKDPTLNVFKPAKLTSDPLRVLLGGKVEVRYDPATGAAPAAGVAGVGGQIDIGHDIKAVLVRPTILKTVAGAGGTPVVAASEVYEDFALMNVAWAQANIRVYLDKPAPVQDVPVADPPAAEAFQDVGFDHDANPATPAAGGGNGRFDFNDVNGDGLHTKGEASEPFTDRAYNPNGAYDFAVNLADGLDEYAPKLTREERALIDALADGDPMTVDMFIVPSLAPPPGSRGESFWAAFAEAKKLLQPNVIIVTKNAVGISDTGTPRDFVVAAHELGHVILNDGNHTTAATPEGRVNLMFGPPDVVDGVEKSKRLTPAQVATARGFARYL